MNKEIRQIANRMTRRATELGLVTKDGKPLVVDLMEELLAAGRGYRNAHAYRAALKDREAPALEQENPEESGCDYALVNGSSCWITMGIFSVHPRLTDEGIVVDVFAKGAEDTSIASTWAMSSDAEFEFCESNGIDIDEVADWQLKQGEESLGTLTAVARMVRIKLFLKERREAAPHMDEVVLSSGAGSMGSAYEVTPDDLDAVLQNHGLKLDVMASKFAALWDDLDKDSVAQAALAADTTDDDEVTLSNQTTAAMEEITRQLVAKNVLTMVHLAVAKNHLLLSTLMPKELLEEVRTVENFLQRVDMARKAGNPDNWRRFVPLNY